MGQGLEFLNRAREKLDDPSISAGTSVHARGIKTKPTAVERFRASSEFHNRSGQTKTLTPGTGFSALNDTAPISTESPANKTKTIGTGSGLAPIFDKKGVQIGLKGTAPKKTGLPVQSKKSKPQRPVFTSGLPTRGMPTFEQLGSELGRISKFIRDTSKFNASRGLPGGKAKAPKKLDKTKISALLKLQENAMMTNPERAKQLDDLIAAELGINFGNSVDADVAAILAD